MIRIKDESEVLGDAALRKAIIEEINGPENQARKDESFRRHTCYKDQTSQYVVRELLKQFDDDTVREMNYSISNISIGRKIIDKLGRVYSSGVQRAGRDDSETEAIEKTSKLVELNRVMKRANRYLRMHHNTIVGVLPCPVSNNGTELYEIKVQAYQPHLYDVIEDYYDREKPKFVILSNYKMVTPQMTSVDPAKANRGASAVVPRKTSDGKDQIIADHPNDDGANVEEYIWWSKYYHFTTNKAGEIISESVDNPIQELPFVNFAMDQEGSYWAQGGRDIFDGAILLNCMITNAHHIGVTQGYGQFWMKGKGLPRFIKAGVNKSILLEVESKDDPDPQLGFASSNPKLQELKAQIEMYAALLLTTNNLSTKAVSSNLSGGDNFASGISLIIDKAESIEDVQEQRDVFYHNEPIIFELISMWEQVYKNSLTDPFKQAMLPADVEAQIKFNDYKPIMSEKEKLENIKLRKELGINSMIELLMQDDQSLTQKQAEEKLLKLLEEQIKETALKAQLNPAPAAPAVPPQEGEEKPEGEVVKQGKYYEDENGDLWEETEDGWRKVTKSEDEEDSEEDDNGEEEVSE